MSSSICALLRSSVAWLLAHKFITCYTLLFIFAMWPTRFASHYDAIPADRMLDELVRATTPNQTLQNADAAAGGVPECEYSDIITTNRFLYQSPYTDAVIAPTDIRLGGEFSPEDCRPVFSTAIIVVYRARERQLDAFLQYIHNYLRAQLLHYRIFLIEQGDAKPFNRGKLFNIGFEFARKAGFPCVVMHDVDLMPMRLGQLYACTKKPRHMCASLDEFRFNLPYLGLFGGAVAMRADQFAEINGFSNVFEGWGGEDDDLFGRLKSREMEICRFAEERSQYAMLPHAKEAKSAERMERLATGRARMRVDGLNSLRYEVKEYREHALFTHVLVDTTKWS